MPYQENGLEFETIDWRRRLLQVGNLSTPTLNHVDRAIKRLKSTGLYTGLSRLNFCVGDGLSASLVPQVAGSVALDTNVNLLSTDYAEHLGWQTDGTTKYIAQGFLPTAATGGMFVYLRTTQASTTTAFCPIGGVLTGTQCHRMLANRDNIGGTAAGSVRAQWGGITTIQSPATTGGMVAAAWHIARRSATDAALYKNGIVAGTDSTSTTAATGLAPFVMTSNTAGSPNAFLAANSRVAGYAFDVGFSAADAATFYAIWQELRRAIGGAV